MSTSGTYRLVQEWLRLANKALVSEFCQPMHLQTWSHDSGSPDTSALCDQYSYKSSFLLANASCRVNNTRSVDSYSRYYNYNSKGQLAEIVENRPPVSQTIFK